MKAQLFGNHSKKKTEGGFSTLEMMIAFAIMLIALSGAISASFSAQYWSIASQTSNEALYKAKTNLEDLRATSKDDFYSAVSTPFRADGCVTGELCYFSETKVTDLSSCSKYAKTEISWKVSGYPTTTTSLSTNLTNIPEAVAEGGDCLLNQPAGNWDTSAQSVGELNFTPGKKFTGIDVLHKKIYAISALAPYFFVYDAPPSVGVNPAFSGSVLSGISYPLNSVDSYEDLSTGRKYAFVTQATTTQQLAVIDITDPHAPALVGTPKTLARVVSTGSHPEGFRAVAYGGRLYVVTQDTAGPEFHIFNIDIPTQPTEVGKKIGLPDLGVELTRTVYDMVIRDQKIGGVTHRFAYLASGVDMLTILDVTDDIVSAPLTTITGISGASEGQSIFLLGNILYVGRTVNSSGPELYAFDVSNPEVNVPMIGSVEVGATVDRIKVSGKYLYMVAYKLYNESTNEIQIWNSEPSLWGTGRLRSYNFPNLAHLGLDVDGDWVYGASYLTANDAIKVIYAP